MQLTELQKTTWQNIGHESAATQKIRNTALQYYLEYREHLKQTHSFIENEAKIQNLFLISYFISQKSQILYDINGKKISNLAFSINQLAKKHNDYKDFFFHLKQMMKKITLPHEAKESQAEINAFMKYFSFVMTLYNKFLSTFDKITICNNIYEKDLENLGGQKQYKDKIKYLLWVMYITFRKVAFKNNMDTIGNTCLLACVYTFFINEIYKQERITSVYAPQICEDLGTFSNIFEQIEQVLLNFFCLKDLKTYQQVRNVFLQFIESITLKCPELKQPFSPKSISINIKKLQQFYYKNMQMSHIDETLFLKNLISNQENVRFTAFGAKRKIAKYQSHNMINCRRALNYDSELKNNQTATTITKKQQGYSQNQTSNNNYLSVIHKIKCSQTPLPLIQATPVNLFATSYNWLYTKSLKLLQNQDHHQLNLEDLLEIGYKSDQYQLGNQEIKQKKHIIQGLFYELLQQYKQDDIEQNQQNVNVCTILSLEVFYYVMNITNRQLTELVKFLNVSWFPIWQGIDKLLNYDKTMPNTIKMHLLLLETSIVSMFIWKEETFLQDLEDKDIKQCYKDFFYRLLHHIAYQIHFIGKALEMPDTLMDQTFILCQFYIKQCNSLMKNMNLDVIVMCSLYGVCRAKNLEVKFKSIMSSYKLINNVDDKAFESLQNFISPQGQPFNIILYYNKVFLKHSKSILMKIKEDKLIGSDQLQQIINPASYVLSPVKSILPSSLTNNLRNNHQINNTPTSHQMLYAYNESPLLKKNRRLNMHNYQQNNEPLRNKFANSQNDKQNQEVYDQRNQPPHQTKRKIYYNNESQILRERSNNVSEMIHKKFGNGKASTLIQKGYHHLKQI